MPVSYTHLDVYKRQGWCERIFTICIYIYLPIENYISIRISDTQTNPRRRTGSRRTAPTGSQRSLTNPFAVRRSPFAVGGGRRPTADQPNGGRRTANRITTRTRDTVRHNEHAVSNYDQSTTDTSSTWTTHRHAVANYAIHLSLIHI